MYHDNKFFKLWCLVNLVTYLYNCYINWTKFWLPSSPRSYLWTFFINMKLFCICELKGDFEYSLKMRYFHYLDWDFYKSHRISASSTSLSQRWWLTHLIGSEERKQKRMISWNAQDSTTWRITPICQRRKRIASSLLNPLIDRYYLPTITRFNFYDFDGWMCPLLNNN